MATLEESISADTALPLDELEKIGDQARKKGVVLHISDAVHFYKWGGHRRQVLHPKVGSRLLAMGAIVLAPGQTFGVQEGPHQHKLSEDTIFVVQGEGRFLLGDRWFPIKAGDVVHISPRVPHCVENTGQMPLITIGGQTPLDMDYQRVVGIWP
ncbi:MAG: cupin domain-containing protein [Chloroflexi bacterium]|nr:cupin domain-containing protein [Chloroflexota bacterium]